MKINNTINAVASNEQYVVQTDVAQGEMPQSDQKEGIDGGKKQFINEIEKANYLQAGTTECQFSVHEETKQIMIKLVDSTTKEVVKEIPSEKILDMVASMCELAGLFVDEKR